MKFPKLVIASDGYCTGVLLDGVFLGHGIERLDFSTEDKGGGMCNTIRIMDLDVRYVSMKEGPEDFCKFLERVAKTEGK